MRVRAGIHKLAARFSHPLLALLIAAMAAVGAIAQCGLLLDADATGRRANAATASVGADAAARSAASPNIAAAAAAVPKPDASRAY
jgi:hypothetical protein